MAGDGGLREAGGSKLRGEPANGSISSATGIKGDRRSGVHVAERESPDSAGGVDGAGGDSGGPVTGTEGNAGSVWCLDIQST